MSGKGEVIQRLERLAQAGADRVMEKRRAVMQAYGDAPFGSGRASPEDRAKQYVPAYYHLGLGHGPLAVQYWADLLAKHGPKETLGFAKDMEQLLNNPKYWQYAVTAATPDVADQGRWLRQQGLHAASAPLDAAVAQAATDPAAPSPSNPMPPDGSGVPLGNTAAQPLAAPPMPSVPSVPNVPPLPTLSGVA